MFSLESRFKNRLKVTRYACAVGCLLIFSALATKTSRAQDLSSVCSASKRALLDSEGRSGDILRFDIYSHDCKIVFSSSTYGHVYISLENYPTVVKAKESFKSNRRYLLSGERTERPLSLDRSSRSFWDRAKAYESDPESLLILRRGTLIIVVIAWSLALPVVEENLRNNVNSAGMQKAGSSMNLPCKSSAVVSNTP